MEVRSDPRPDVRHVATRSEWDRIVLSKAGPCRACGAASEEFHHVVPRSQRGSDVAANIIPLCSSCHRVYTDRGAGWEGIASAIRCSLTPVEESYARAVKSRAWLDRFLPKGDAHLCAKCKRPLSASEKPQEPSEPRKRKRWVISVPDDAEDGADVLDGLVEACRPRVAKALGYEGDVPAYFVVSAVLADWLSE